MDGETPVRDPVERAAARTAPNDSDFAAATQRDVAPLARDQAAEARDTASAGAGDARHAAEDRVAAADDRRAAALDRYGAADHLQNAYRDDLTGMSLRDAGRDQLSQEVDRAHRTGSRSSSRSPTWTS